MMICLICHLNYFEVKCISSLNWLLFFRTAVSLTAVWWFTLFWMFITNLAKTSWPGKLGESHGKRNRWRFVSSIGFLFRAYPDWYMDCLKLIVDRIQLSVLCARVWQFHFAILKWTVSSVEVSLSFITKALVTSLSLYPMHLLHSLIPSDDFGIVWLYSEPLSCRH